MNDGSVYSSAEGEERVAIDDTIMIDIGEAYTCNYAGTANNNAGGLNVTMAVLGPYDSGDKVEVIYRTSSGGSGSLLTDYRRARDPYFNVSFDLLPPDSRGFTDVSVLRRVHPGYR